MKKIAALVLALLASCVLAAPAHAADPTPMDLSWPRTTATRNIYVIDQTGSLVPVTDAVNIWNRYLQVNGIPIRFIKVTSCNVHLNCTSVVQKSSDTYRAITEILPNGRTIVRVPRIIIYVGSGRNHISKYPLCIRSSLILHEMGHVLGLGHDPRRFDLMYYRIEDNCRTATSPTAVNMQALVRAYR